MALTSPGVEVTIIDQSQYLPAPGGTVPLIVFATAQNKANPSGTAVAPGTTAANAGKLYQITSQKDLVDFYGVPFFYTTTAGTPIQGYELNEYGLLAAYSALGITNRVYTLRADIDLSSLVGQVGRPSGAPTNGAWWLDTTNTTWGIFQFNAVTGAFSAVTPLVITDAEYLNNGYPVNSLGNIGDYAINATVQADSEYQQYYYKTSNNVWTVLGSATWQKQWPTVQGTESNPSLTAGDTFNLSLNGVWSKTITVPDDGGGVGSVTGVATTINALGYTWVTAVVTSGKLNILSSQPSVTGNQYIGLTEGSGSTALADMGIDEGDYYQPQVVYGTSAEMPLWTSSQTYPHPTGSVWIKASSAGLGLTPVLAQYNSTAGSWRAKNVTLATNDWSASSQIDSTGGQAIAVDTVYAEYDVENNYVNRTNPIYLWGRGATGPTVATGSETNFVINLNLSLSSASLYVQTSLPNSSSLSSTYTVTIPDNCTPTQFVTAWLAAGIPYTNALVTTDGAVQLINTVGGEIVMNDFITTAGANQGFSSGILSQAGFVANSTDFVKYGSALDGGVCDFAGLVTTNVTGTGSGMTVQVSIEGNAIYAITGDGVNNGGTGYAAGNQVKVSGALLGGTSPANDLILTVVSVGGSGTAGAVTYVSGSSNTLYNTQISNWVPISFTANQGAPVAAPANGTNWFWSVVDQVDIMVQSGGQWNGYKNINYDSNGFPTPTGSNATNATGPIIAATAPTTQSDGTTALVYGDLWIDTSNLEVYPAISRWQYDSASLTDMWVALDITDQTSSTGVLFADARWATNGDVNVVDDPIPSITSLLTSDYLDLDAPSATLYPTGMLLFNTRRSGYNVKEYQANYFNGTNFPDEPSYPNQTATWLSVSGLKANGSPYMGRQAQRNMVVKSLRSVIDTNYDIRDEDNFFNLMATPGYPEAQPNMVVLNADRGETGYILGDTPMRLPSDATAIQAWATNAAGATATGEDGLVTRNTYLGLFYPSGITSDLSGNLVAVPPSHMMLRTFIRNDNIAYPWLAAAGTRRGNIDNATNIGYIDNTTGEFITTKTRIGIRDVLYINFINPLVFFTGIGLLNYGNKTSYNSSSALDRVNVARLIAYVRRQLTLAARPFVFEPNDALTRQQIAGVIQTLMVDLVAKRGIYDYLVICDESNNTPARIDRNELWVDVALEPVKAAEFIYVPVRVLNTGEIASL
jgi:hypothetical protein